MSDLVSRANEIEALHQRARQSARAAIEAALECGRLLIEAKAAVAHGGWLPWLSTHTTISARQAQKYMRLAEHRAALEGKYDSETHLTLTDALAGLATPRALPAPEDEVKMLPAGVRVEFHPAGKDIPSMTEDEHRRLLESIRRHGVLVPVLVHDGMILDGRERWKACQELGFDCPFRIVTVDDPAALVWDLNTLRR